LREFHSARRTPHERQDPRGFADDHPIVLAGLRNLIETEADLGLIGEANSGQSALKLIRDRQPDVAVIDISMPEINGITLARRLAEDCPGVCVIILTLYEERSFLKQALAAGVKGYVLKRSAAENLVSAIRAVQLGETYVDPLLGDEVREGGSPPADKVPKPRRP
jgi:DNA-binding NarL/FixJ family response regulator